MSDMKITGAGIGQDSLQIKGGQKTQEGGFDTVLKDAIGKVTEMQGEPRRESANSQAAEMLRRLSLLWKKLTCPFRSWSRCAINCLRHMKK